MATTEELSNHREAIKKAQQEGEFARILQIIKVLKSEKVCAQTLKDSMVGKTMTSLSKLSDFEDNEDKARAQKEASELLVIWKKAVEDEKRAKKAKEDSKEEQKVPDDHKFVKPLTSDEAEGVALKKQESMSQVQLIDFKDVEDFFTKSKPRDAFRKSIFDILCERCPSEVLSQKF